MPDDRIDLEELERDLETEIGALWDSETTPDDFGDALMKALIAAVIAAYLLGRGIDETELSEAEKERLQAWIDEQRGYLAGFIAAIEAGERPGNWANRASMYASAIVAPFWWGKTYGLILPAYPGDLSTICGQKCHCAWYVEDLGDDNYDAYWRLGIAEHCPDCAERAILWAPLRIRHGEYKEFTLKERIDAKFKHLSGRHNQKRHGWRGQGLDAARRAMRSGVSDDFAHATTPEAERDAARAKFGLTPLANRAQFEAAQKRINEARENIVGLRKQQADIEKEIDAARTDTDKLESITKRWSQTYDEMIKKNNESWDLEGQVRDLRRREELPPKVKKAYDDAIRIDRLMSDMDSEVRYLPYDHPKREAYRELRKQYSKANDEVEKYRGSLNEDGKWYDVDGNVHTLRKLHPLVEKCKAARAENERLQQEVAKITKEKEALDGSWQRVNEGYTKGSAVRTALEKAENGYANSGDAKTAMRYLRAQSKQYREKLAKDIEKVAKLEREADQLLSARTETRKEIAKKLGKDEWDSEVLNSPDYESVRAKSQAVSIALNKESAQLSESLRSTLAAKNPLKVDVDYDQYQESPGETYYTAERVAEARVGGMESMSKLVPHNPLVASERIGVRNLVKQNEDDRAHGSREGMHLQNSDSAWTVVHEMGHVIEGRDPLILRQSVAFLGRRTKGYKQEKLSDLNPGAGYRESEVTVKDKFADDYIGKQYSYTTMGGKRVTYATEVLSMGIQDFFQNPARLAAKDPDMFDYIFAVLRLGSD